MIYQFSYLFGTGVKYLAPFNLFYDAVGAPNLTSHDLTTENGKANN